MDLLRKCLQGSVSPHPQLSALIFLSVRAKPICATNPACSMSLHFTEVSTDPVTSLNEMLPNKASGLQYMGLMFIQTNTNSDQIRLNLCLGSHRNRKGPLCYFTNVFVHQRVTMWSFSLASSFGSEGHLSNGWDVSVDLCRVCFISFSSFSSVMQCCYCFSPDSNSVLGMSFL